MKPKFLIDLLIMSMALYYRFSHMSWTYIIYDIVIMFESWARTLPLSLNKNIKFSLRMKDAAPQLPSSPAPQLLASFILKSVWFKDPWLQVEVSSIITVWLVTRSQSHSLTIWSSDHVIVTLLVFRRCLGDLLYPLHDKL